MKCITYRCDECGKVLSDEYNKIDPVADIHIHTRGLLTISYKDIRGRWCEKEIFDGEAQWCPDCLNKKAKSVTAAVIEERITAQRKAETKNDKE